MMAPLARAQEPILGASWTTVIQGLRQDGIDRVGDLDLIEFEKQAQEIQWQQIDPTQIAALAEGRRSAYFLVREKEVFVSNAISNELDKPALELHEAFGATGYNDRDYSLSSSLLALSKMQTKETKLKMTKVLGSTIFTQESMSGSGSGSGSGVGGGGDLIALSAKNQFVEFYLEKHKSDLTVEALKTILKVNFEPLHDPAQQFVAFQYLTRDLNDQKNGDQIPGVIQNRLSGIQEQLSFYIPALLWQRDQNLRKPMIETAVAYIEQIIPVTGQSSSPKNEVYECGVDKILFLKDPSHDVISMIQASRLAVNFGCHDPQYMVFREIRIPGFIDYQGNETTDARLSEEEKARIIPALCRLESEGQIVREFKTSFLIGKDRVLEYGTALGSKIFSGTLRTDAKGFITSLQLRMTENSKQVKNQIQLQKPDRQAEVSLRTSSNQEVRMRCEQIVKGAN